MRNKINIQPCFPLFFRVPKEVVEFQKRYNRIDHILNENPEILELVHADLRQGVSPLSAASNFCV